MARLAAGYCVAVVALIAATTVQAAYQLGYTAESCDDLRPQRVPFIQDLIAGGGQPVYSPDGTRPVNFGSPTGFNNQPGAPSPNSPGNQAPRPDGQVIQPILMTTVSPYRIWVSENRYKRGKIMEGMARLCVAFVDPPS